VTGRFLSRDPAPHTTRRPEGENFGYNFVAQQTYSYRDPTGESLLASILFGSVVSAQLRVNDASVKSVMAATLVRTLLAGLGATAIGLDDFAAAGVRDLASVVSLQLSVNAARDAVEATARARVDADVRRLRRENPDRCVLVATQPVHNPTAYRDPVQGGSVAAYVCNSRDFPPLLRRRPKVYVSTQIPYTDPWPPVVDRWEEIPGSVYQIRL